MKNNLLYLGMMTTTLLFTACSEDTAEKDRQTIENSETQQESSTSTSENLTTEAISEVDTTESTEETTKEEVKESVQNANEANPVQEITSFQPVIPFYPHVDSKAEEENIEVTTETVMIENTTYNIYKGESIVPISENPQVVIETDITTGKTITILRSGEAKIININ